MPDTYYTEHTTSKSRKLFSYVRVIQNHPPTPVRNSKYLAIPPTPLSLRNIKMVPYTNLILFPGPVGGTFSIISVICLIFHILIYTAFKKLRTPAAQNLLALTCALCPAQFFLSTYP